MDIPPLPRTTRQSKVIDTLPVSRKQKRAEKKKKSGKETQKPLSVAASVPPSSPRLPLVLASELEDIELIASDFPAVSL